MAQEFDPIILDVVLWDYAEDKFVRAILEADGTVVPIATIPVPHKAGGRYLLYDPSNIFFPINTDHLSITYEVYNDAGFTEKSLVHGPAHEHYVKDNSIPGGDPEILAKLNQVIDIVTSHDVNSQVIGLLDDDEVLTGIVQPLDAIGFVNDDLTLTGFILDTDDPQGNIFDDDDLTGTID